MSNRAESFADQAGEASQAIARAEELLTARDVLAARAMFYRAEQLGWNADHCSGGRWLASMLAGDYEAAWRDGDAIRARGTPDEHRFWRGEEIRGRRLIVRSLHGFGDAVQMLRFAPVLAARAASVVYEVPPRFVEIAPCFPGIEHVITWGEDAPTDPPVWDVQVEVMELPYLLRLQPTDLPGATNYLQVPGQELDRVAQAMGERRRPRAGLVWTCGEWNLTRCLPVETLALLLSSDAVEFWSLASVRHSAEADRLALRDASSICGDGLLALAATIANLDLVITVDTLAAHVAGALGKPVWLMLQHAADWRWMVGRSDSPWYPSMRLFRQPRPGDWQGVVEAVRTALATDLVG